jgi:hypothetical protein
MSFSADITRREAIRRVTALMGGVALVGGSALLNGCRDQDDTSADDRPFTPEEIAYLDEIAETILPVFREGLRAIDEASRKAHGVPFMQASPAQRLAVLEPIDRDQKSHSDARKEAGRKKSLAYLSDQRQEQAPGTNVGAATAITEDTPAHYFRMMKELALLGYFTSEIGMTQAQRYVESPGRFDPCAPYTPGEKAWAPHA